ncbi:hypothetical protein CLR69_14275 [Pectobacterium zantedeschiae]|uniref:Uncharacterized protein n=1 Tax=Pectobacterium zantedeschiae TaxID=2034769 RepID=A0A9X8JN64_9GAMM|nr:hypothetical protein CLR69_14275 [Pectobacterium zantedeschiae]
MRAISFAILNLGSVRTNAMAFERPLGRPVGSELRPFNMRYMLSARCPCPNWLHQSRLLG